MAVLSQNCFRILMQQHKEDNQNIAQDLEQLKQKVKLSSNKLLQLTYNDSKFVQKLVQLNQKAKQLINQDFVEEPLIYLAQAERVLEYGASCGKTIDRNIIICTLHNEACCYYKASDLVTASRYIQAVIFNIKTHLDSVNSSPSHSVASDHQRGKKTDDLLFVTFEKKIELIQYYLKYCTVNSQAKNRIVALDASKRVISVLKSLFNDIRQNQKIIKTEENELESNDLRMLMRQIKLFKEDLALSEYENYLLLAKMAIKKWNENKVVKKINFNLQKHISNYSISEVIDMVPIQYSGEPEEQYSINSRCIMRQILHFAMGYFTISTEYRLISQQLYKKQEERIKSQEYLKSNIYHLLSIIFLALNVNCDLLFMKQIISSYEHHFKTLLITQEILDGSLEELSQKLLYQKPVDNLKSINNSLAAKIKKLKSKSKSKDKKIHSQYDDTQLYESKAAYKMNQSKQASKSKRTNSKQKVISQSKKPIKVLNDSLLESTKVANNKAIKKEERSVSKSNKKQVPKKRSVSKEAQIHVKSLKSPPKQAEKPSTKRTNDEYQLSNSKCPARKRTQSISLSADLSCSIKQTNRTKMTSCDKQEKKIVKKKKTQNKSKQKGLKDTKQTYSKHYYV